jgi:hypothetical protein
LRGLIVTVVVFAVVALGAAAGLAAAHPDTATIVHKPTATVMFTVDSVSVKGKYFQKRELLTVALSSTTIEKKWTKKVKATATGTFALNFGAIGLNSCNQYTLKIVGSLKSRFTTSHAFVPC